MSHRGHPLPGTSTQATRHSTPPPITWQTPLSQPVSRAPSRPASAEPGASHKHSNGKGSGVKSPPLEEDDFSDFGSDFEDMDDRRPTLHRPTDGLSHQPETELFVPRSAVGSSNTIHKKVYHEESQSRYTGEAGDEEEIHLCRVFPGIEPGVMIIAYGDKDETVGDDGEKKEAKNRLAGNIVIGIGSVLYGFYEVLYKKLACPPEGTSPGRGMIFANTFGSLIGTFTLTVLWIPLPILHYMEWETFELPHGDAARLLWVSVLANAIFSGSFLVLISLTSPVLSSVAALLTIFLVAIADWVFTGKAISPAAMVGGILIIGAFCMLSWSTYREMAEERRRKSVDITDSDSDKDDA
ncbi:putative Uncharacterized vacuolar membrane protein [Glarea lozoyensis 74030]|uniref:Putative Uncharacterized vacuolar membrane protein n=1 Tax=Glarea lozoyensis (strain ATCC 74030 / MF5533) TaxID=1104152 RepID=H0EMY3_GLAL7|nr:putative Uncharacterized vacuolar membrane protein [Glarea lozoyensis 74030]